MLKSFVALTGLVFAAAPALAVDTSFTFNLNGSGTAVKAPKASDPYGNSRTYTQSQIVNGKALTVSFTVSAWTLRDGVITNAFLGNNTASNGGLYDINRFEGSGANNTHTIDNQNGMKCQNGMQCGVDFLLFQFNRNVELTGVTANAFSVGGSLDNDLTIGRSVSPSDTWSTLNGMAVSDMADLFQAQKNIYSHTTYNSKGVGTLDVDRVLNPAGSSRIAGQVWMISASLANLDGKIDGFKLDTLKLQTNSSMGVLGVVPEPATWGMMIVGFGAIGAAARRRKTGLAHA